MKMKRTASVALIVTRFILIEPQHRANLGSAARALKTMGFTELSLVRPRDPKILNRVKTKEWASGAVDVLENAQVHEHLEDALADINIRCGTGMPHDMYRQRIPRSYQAPRPFFADLIPSKLDRHCFSTSAEDISIAFLFGNEKMGMKEEEMDMCDMMLGIPTNPKFGSLNLGAAVQLLAYDWREAIGGFSVGDVEEA